MGVRKGAKGSNLVPGVLKYKASLEQRALKWAYF